MQGFDRHTTLKHNERRSVLLQAGADGAQAEVVKRFHSPGRIARLRDETRAREEFALLQTLSQRGFPSPAPLRVRAIDGGWELAMRWIEDALTLDDLLEARAAWPVPAEQLARTLGGLLARAHMLGLDHPDLHAGNVLIQRTGDAWLVDLHGARLRRGFSARIAQRDLVCLTAGVRERLSCAFRARFLASYLRALPAAATASLLRGGARAPSARALRGPFARKLEEQARRHRARVVEHARWRWLRRSSACTPIADAQLDGFHARTLERPGLEALVRRVERLALRAPDARHDAQRLPGADTDERVLLALVDRPGRELRDAWFSAVRLCDHGLGCAQPLLLLRRPRACAVFALPTGAHSWREHTAARDVSDDPRARRRLARALGHLLGGLHDRGWSLAALSPDELFVDRAGQASFGIGLQLVTLDRDALRVPWRLAQTLIGAHRPRERAAFIRAYACAQRAGRNEQMRVERELCAARGIGSDG